MEHKVTLTVELTVEAPDVEEAEKYSYWIIEPLLEEAKTSAYNINGCQLNDFNIKIN